MSKSGSFAPNGNGCTHKKISPVTEERSLNLRYQIKFEETIQNVQMDPEAKSKNLKPTTTTTNKLFIWIQNISVEPIIGIFFIASAFTFIVDQEFYLHKSCTADHGFPEEICRHLNENKTIAIAVQRTVAEYFQWSAIPRYLLPIFFSAFLGNWSDVVGRKLPLLMSQIAMIICIIMMIVNALMPAWNLNMIIYTANLPFGLLGGDLGIQACAFAYLSDITTARERTIRFAILDIVIYVTIPLGGLLASYIYIYVVNGSFVWMYTICVSFHIAGFLYTTLRLKHRTADHHAESFSMQELLKLFDASHITESIKSVTKVRPAHGRLHLWILFTVLILNSFPNEEKSTSYLYTHLTFNWNSADFSYGVTAHFILGAIILVFGVPIATRTLKLKETMLIMIGASICAIGKAILALANLPWLFYVGMGFCGFACLPYSMTKALLSKITHVTERGKLFFALTMCDHSVPVVLEMTYSGLYAATIEVFPTSIYWLTFSSQFITVPLIAITHFSRSTQTLIDIVQNSADEPRKSVTSKCNGVES